MTDNQMLKIIVEASDQGGFKFKEFVYDIYDCYYDYHEVREDNKIAIYYSSKGSCKFGHVLLSVADLVFNPRFMKAVYGEKNIQWCNCELVTDVTEDVCNDCTLQDTLPNFIDIAETAVILSLRNKPIIKYLYDNIENGWCKI